MFGTLAARIAANVTVTKTGCHEWQGKKVKSSGGQFYGRINIYEGGKTVSKLVHRVVLELALGRKLRPDEVGMHQCDNTICCNPKHLKAGTQTANMAEMVQRGRDAAARRKAAAAAV